MPTVEYLEVPASELRKNPWNSNKVDVENEAKIRESIKRNGIFKPIIVRQVEGQGGYEIIGGEHRWEQAVEMGIESIPIANLGEIDERQAKEIGVIDNARYGADDTLLLSDILKDIGVDEIEHFLPFGETDISAIFSVSDIALDDLDIAPDDAEDAPEEQPEQETAEKPTRTHQNMRFRVQNADAARLTALISRTQKEQGFTTEDELTNAGDALIHLLSAQLSEKQSVPSTQSLDDLEATLSEIETAQDSDDE